MSRALLRSLVFVVLCSLSTACPPPAAADGGTGGGSSGGGSSGGGSAAGGAGGGAAAGGAGGGTVVPYDGGTPCASSPRPRLQCDPPVVLADGGLPYSLAALAASGAGLVAGWVTGNQVELEQLTGAGRTALVSEDAGRRIFDIQVAAEGSAWALVYSTGVASPVRCFSSAAAAGVTPGSTGTFSSGVGIAVAANGAVGLVTGGSGALNWAVTANGCPSSLRTTSFNEAGQAVNAVHAPQGFRFTTAALINAANGTLAIVEPLPDGGLASSSTFHAGDGPDVHSATLSSNGSQVLVTYAWLSPTVYELSAQALPVGGGPIDPASKRLFTNVGSWSTAGCGAGCLAVAAVPNVFNGPLTALFTSESMDAGMLTASDAGWDVSCSENATPTAVAVAQQGGRLHFLVADIDQVRLFSCAIPPL